MVRKNTAHDIVMESLTDALLKIMEQKPLAEINVSELCRRAGVSRVSYYRNFNTMEDILVQYLNKCTDEWWQDFSKKPESEFYRTFWSELLEQYRKNKKLIFLLYQNNASHLLKEHIFSRCSPKPDLEEKEAYIRAALAGFIYGLVDEWIRRGMKELPKQFHIQKILAMYRNMTEEEE